MDVPNQLPLLAGFSGVSGFFGVSGFSGFSAAGFFGAFGVGVLVNWQIELDIYDVMPRDERQQAIH